MTESTATGNRALGGTPGSLRSRNRIHILREIRDGSTTSRAGLVQRTGLSHPTVSAIVNDLLAQQMVRETGRKQGGPGRPGTLLEFNAERGYVLGVDVGGTRMRAALGDLNGNLLAQNEQPTTHARGRAVVDQLLSLARQLANQVPNSSGSLLAAGIGTPGVFDPESSRIRFAPNVRGLADVGLAEAVSETLEVPVRLENDVNMAALGERWRGVARSARSFAVIAIGSGAGVGIMLNGELWRGQHGAAGEIGYAPIPEARELSEDGQGPLESRLGAAGLRETTRQVLAEIDAPSYLRDRDVEAVEIREIFELASAGDPVAREACDRHAHVATLGVATLVSLLDPELVVLAGGIGANEYLRQGIVERLPRHIPLAPPVLRSGLGDAAQLYGALAVAREMGLAELESLLSTEGGR